MGVNCTFVVLCSDRRNVGSATTNTTHSEPVSTVYATVNRPSADTVSRTTIYADMEMTQQPIPSSNADYPSVEPISDPNSPASSSGPMDKAVKATCPIYLEAKEVKHGAKG